MALVPRIDLGATDARLHAPRSPEPISGTADRSQVNAAHHATGARSAG